MLKAPTISRLGTGTLVLGVLLSGVSGCQATDGSDDNEANLAGSYLTGLTATNDENSTNAAVLVDGQEGYNDTQWTSSNPWSAANYPMRAIINLGSVVGVTEIDLFHGNGTNSGVVEVSYLPAGDATGNDTSYVVIENHATKLWNSWETVAQSGTIQTQYVRVAINNLANLSWISEVRVRGVVGGGAVDMAGTTKPADMATAAKGDMSQAGGSTGGDSNANVTVPAYTGQFSYGANPGYYNSSLTDSDVYELGANAGVHSTRASMPDDFMHEYGNTVHVADFEYFYDTLGFRNNTVFLNCVTPGSGWPAPDRDTTVTDGVQSLLWQGMYDAIWTNEATGTVNPSNTLAVYVANVVQNYGPYVTFYEIVNEPDFTYNTNIAVAAAGTTGSWLTGMPSPTDLTNLQAPITSYIRVLRVAYAVIKHFQPNAYVTPGGMGYPNFLDALLRYTDNPTDGSVTSTYPLTGGAYIDAISWHIYPEYDVYAWQQSLNSNGGGFAFSRYSDFLISAVQTQHNAFQAVLTKYGYDGTKYPKKIEIVTESGISQKQLNTTSGQCVTGTTVGPNDCTGGVAINENYTAKALVQAQRLGIAQWYWLATGNSADVSTANTSTPYDYLMGFYNNLVTTTSVASAVLNTQGTTELSTSKLLYGYAYDAAQSAKLALPSTVDGAAFTNSSGAHIYALWAKTTTDQSETASATYSFPSAVGVSSLTRYEITYSQTNASASSGTTNIALTGAPSFFR